MPHGTFYIVMTMDPKGFRSPLWWLVYSTTTYLLGDNGFLQPRRVTMNAL